MNQRYYALDVFRGMTVALMILVNTPGTWEWIYWPLRHAEWHGLTPTDLVFPFFLFAVGNAMAFVMPKLQKSGDAVFWQKVVKRTLIIFGIGILLNWFPFVSASLDKVTQSYTLKPTLWSYDDGGTKFGGIRILGVLQRIAICYFFASVMVYYLKRNGAIAGAAALLLAYWAVCYLGNPSDPYSLVGWVGNQMDLNILQKEHIYFNEYLYFKPELNKHNGWAKTATEIGPMADSFGNAFSNSPLVRDSMLRVNNIMVKTDGQSAKILFDPEGLLSTMSAIAQVILGYVIGKFILDNGSNRRTVERILIIGLVLGFVGTVWHEVFPVNKKIWTSSYTVLTTGMACMFLGIFIYLFEIVKISQVWGKFFDAFGKNPLFIFVLSGALPRLLGLILINDGVNSAGKIQTIKPLPWVYKYVFKDISSDLQVGSFAYAIFMILFYWLIAYIMDKKKIYVKV